ncbi:TetR/AcrR family transcriptional regulator [Mangrovicoccus sp. HB161399]|uniref:TetR/AcrR family transcriptional regulator n=1 Tax=Mangrovicoccus sp. HB161399 TaxID=2720392 RepID=UPI0015554867|nr:TetR/AcrR family transcriptional regulator [Mangrovicoccus sp. HB161399]
MAGLRERKKAATRKRILDCAAQMFREDGYEASRIEDIAEAAELSVATFYNYFGSKADLLLAAVLEETAMVMEAVEACIRAPVATLEEGFGAIVATYFRTSFQYSSREVWRMAVARTMLDPEAEFSRRYIEIDRELSDQLCRFLAEMQGRGLVRADVGTEPAGRLLFNNVNMNFIEFMRASAMTAEEIRSKVMAESAPLLSRLAA